MTTSPLAKNFQSFSYAFTILNVTCKIICMFSVYKEEEEEEEEEERINSYGATDKRWK